MFKNAIRFTISVFVALIISQWIFRPEIVWLDIFGISILVFLFYILFEWIDNKNNSKKDY